MHDTKRAGWAAKLLVLPPLLFAQSAAAEIVVQSENGFVVRLVAEVTAPPADAWRTLTTPALWWSGQHTFSGDSANLTFDPVVGGCFCETLPRPESAPSSQKAGTQKAAIEKLGGVQHLRVVYIEPPRAMRLTGALGPLQSEALSATMTMTIKPTDTPAGKGSRILFEYVVGGFMRYKVDDIAPAVDRMLAAQLSSLAGKLGPITDDTPPAKAGALKSREAAGPPAPDGEGPPLSAEPKVAAPLSSTATYSLPPARRGAPALAPQPVRPATKPPGQAVSVPAPAPLSKITPKPAPILAKTPAKPAAKLPARSLAKPAAKAPDDEAHNDANAAFDALLGAAPAPVR